MSTNPPNLNRLLLLQKPVIRTITKQAFDAHTKPIVKELGILKLNEIYLLQIGKLMYLYKIGLLPNSLNNMFLIVNQVNKQNTRNKHSFYTTSCVTKVGQFSFQYQGPKVFNTLSFDIQNSTVLLYLIQIWKKSFPLSYSIYIFFFFSTTVYYKFVIVLTVKLSSYLCSCSTVSVPTKIDILLTEKAISPIVSFWAFSSLYNALLL